QGVGELEPGGREDRGAEDDAVAEPDGGTAPRRHADLRGVDDVGGRLRRRLAAREGERALLERHAEIEAEAAPPRERRRVARDRRPIVVQADGARPTPPPTAHPPP